jgi:hypothetical protein
MVELLILEVPQVFMVISVKPIMLLLNQVYMDFHKVLLKKERNIISMPTLLPL